MQFKDIKNIKFSKSIFSQLFLLISARVKLFVFVLFLLLAGYCFHIWYSYVYSSRWSAEKEAEYILSHNNDVTFDTKKFKVIVDKKRMREEEYQEKLDAVSDFFHLE